MSNQVKIKKGDKVMVIAGRDKGKTGIVERVFPKTLEVIVAGVNMVKKHVKVSQKYPSGGVVEVNKPLANAKVAIVCPNCGKPSRIGFEIKGKEKNRVCKKCGKAIMVKKVEGKEK
jgi:large subunit ribosomal protein L24